MNIERGGFVKTHDLQGNTRVASGDMYERTGVTIVVISRCRGT